MRTGANPAKSGLAAYSPRRLGIVTIVYIPITEGYFANSLQIFKLMLDSIRANGPYVEGLPDFDLLVFDNGSCPEVTEELEKLYHQGLIDWLMLSQHNLGKAGAWNWIFGAMPNELICYADSDVLFRPGWLEASLKLLAAFPQAGMVGAQPNFFDVMQGTGQAHLKLSESGEYKIDDYWPAQEIIDEYCLGIGASDELAKRFQLDPLPAMTNLANGAQAVLGASHMQFIIPREVARKVLPLPATRALLRKETMSLDYKIDELGFLHLSTREPYVFHMGNTINDRLHVEVQRATSAAGPVLSTGENGLKEPDEAVELPNNKGLTYQSGRSSTPAAQRLLGRIVRQKALNPYFLKLYNLLFRLLNYET